MISSFKVRPGEGRYGRLSSRDQQCLQRHKRPDRVTLSGERTRRLIQSGDLLGVQEKLRRGQELGQLRHGGGAGEAVAAGGAVTAILCIVVLYRSM
jgi:hypothetical protein